MRASTFNFFSQLGCNIHFENLDEFLVEFGQLSTDNIVFRLQRYLLSQQGKGKFNVILAWDFFNYLPPEALKTLLEILEPYCEENCLLHILSYTAKNIPSQPQHFAIKDQYQIALSEAEVLPRRLANIDTMRLLKHSPGYSLQESLMSKDGMQAGITEYLLRFTQGKAVNTKRAYSKMDLHSQQSGGSEQRKSSPEPTLLHRSPGLAALQGEKHLRVLDLGPTNHHNASIFAQQYHEVYSENVLSHLFARKQNNNQDGTEFGLSFLNFELSLRFDHIFFWDILNFLDARQLNELLVRLRPFIHPGSAMFVFLYTQRSAPGSARMFKIMQGSQLALADSGLKAQPFQPHSAIEFTKCLPGLRIAKTWLFQAGMQPGINEYLLHLDS